MVTLISRSPEETLALGRIWGRTAPDRWIVGLSGDLGTGKTQLVKGLAEGLGVSARVHSPTFAIIHEYTRRTASLVHLDLYRLETPAQLLSARVEEELLSPRGVVVVEWFERWVGAGLVVGLTARRHVNLTVLGESERQITYEDIGA
jgi:tRNA threonylcarbamoyladenosine biosynthesis protein TsaE